MLQACHQLFHGAHKPTCRNCSGGSIFAFRRREVGPRLLAWVAERAAGATPVLAAHNGRKFDVPMLQARRTLNRPNPNSYPQPASLHPRFPASP